MAYYAFYWCQHVTRDYDSFVNNFFWMFLRKILWEADSRKPLLVADVLNYCDNFWYSALTSDANMSPEIMTSTEAAFWKFVLGFLFLFQILLIFKSHWFLRFSGRRCRFGDFALSWFDALHELGHSSHVISSRDNIWWWGWLHAMYAVGNQILVLLATQFPGCFGVLSLWWDSLKKRSSLDIGCNFFFF